MHPFLCQSESRIQGGTANHGDETQTLLSGGGGKFKDTTKAAQTGLAVSFLLEFSAAAKAFASMVFIAHICCCAPENNGRQCNYWDSQHTKLTFQPHKNAGVT